MALSTILQFVWTLIPKVMNVQAQRHLEKSSQWEHTDEEHKQRLTISTNKVFLNSSFFQTEYGICHHSIF